MLYYKYCGSCHGNSAISGGLLPVMRYTQMHAVWQQVVLEGSLRSRGMVSFDQVLNQEDAHAIQSYVIARVHRDKANLEEMTKNEK